VWPPGRARSAGVVRAGRQLSLVTTLDLGLLLAISRQLLEVSALPIAPGAGRRGDLALFDTAMIRSACRGHEMLGVTGRDAFAALDLGGRLVPGQGTLPVLAVAGDPTDCV
jgi:hypothetical protein